MHAITLQLASIPAIRSIFFSCKNKKKKDAAAIRAIPEYIFFITPEK
jgi:hypothetical protein